MVVCPAAGTVGRGNCGIGCLIAAFEPGSKTTGLVAVVRVLLRTSYAIVTVRVCGARTCG